MIYLVSISTTERRTPTLADQVCSPSLGEQYTLTEQRIGYRVEAPSAADALIQIMATADLDAEEIQLHVCPEFSLDDDDYDV